MNASQCLAALGIVSGMFCCTSSEQTTKQQPTQNIRENLALSHLGDLIGNRNYELDVLEEDYLKRVLHQSTGMIYLLTQYANNQFSVHGGENWSNGARLFSSEEEVRAAYKGVGIRGQVGILGFDRQGNLVEARYSSGYISKNVWRGVTLPSCKELEEILDY